MKKPIITVIVLAVLAGQSLKAQQRINASSQLDAASNRTARIDYTPAGRSGSGMDMRSQTSYRRAESSVTLSAPINTAYQSESKNIAIERVSTAMSRPSSDYRRYNGNVNISAHNTGRQAFTTSNFLGYTGVHSTVVYDTSKGCNGISRQKWDSPLARWLRYRHNLRHNIYDPYPEEGIMGYGRSVTFTMSVAPYTVVRETRISDMNTFYDGYIVYCDDTAFGLINLTTDGVYFDGGDLQLLVPYKQKGLSAVVLYNDNQQELYLARIGNSNYLSRVLHDGKLMVYDTYYSFNRSDFSCGSLEMAYDNKPIRPFVILDPRLHMIRTINKVYGANLKMSDYDWDRIVQHLNQLD